MPTPDNVDLAHADLNVREQAIDCYLRLLDLAAELDNRSSPPTATSAGFVP
ncbi:MAG: hypothetical protein GXP38_06125 [Chloroflexi bacterium]|nr:hypothetical protein [Chloroflexota bacterium]